MPLLDTVVAGIGRVALGAAFNGPRLAAMKATPKDPLEAPGERTLRPASTLPQALMYAMVASTWLSERKTLTSRKLEKEASSTVALKDLMVAGTVMTGFANVVAEEP